MIRLGARASLVSILFASSAWSIAAAPACIAAGEGANEASVVIDSGTDATRYCVRFDDTITGLDALKQTGAALRLQDYGAGQVIVCAIDEVGCRYPDERCFCQFGEETIFWGYYRADTGGAWSFSEQGAADAIVEDGSVEAWRYAAHDETGGNAPKIDVKSLPCARPAAAVRPDAVTRSTVALVGVFTAMILILLIGRVVRRRMDESA